MTRSDVAGDSFLGSAKQSLQGRTALVISCGPSMKKWPEVLSSLASESPYVVCVKQAVNELGARCDLHVFNVYNVQRYRRASPHTVRVLGTVPEAPPVFSAHDIRYVVRKQPEDKNDLQATLAGQLPFETHDFDLTGMDRRPWGPGVMYEFVLPYLVWCGVSKIVTVGWDIADPNGRNQHFYDGAARQETPWQRLPQRLGKAMYMVMRRHRMTFTIYNFGCHLLGRRYNPAPMQAGEAELVASSIPKLKRWLAERQVRLVVHSTSDWLQDALRPEA